MNRSFGDMVRRMRLDAGLGLRELARRIRISPGYISDVENGRVSPPSESVILDMADALGADRRELLRAASKVDPELSNFVAHEPGAADFLRMAKDQQFDTEDWKRLGQWVKTAKLGKKEDRS